jgi:hypothetical protein
MMAVMSVVVIKRRFEISERMLIFFALVSDDRESIANRIKDCFLRFFQFRGVVSHSAL